MKASVRFLEHPERCAGFLFWHTTNLWQRKVNAALKSVELTHVQLALMAGTARLSRRGETINQTLLAAHAKIDVMMTSQVLRTLEAKGLIARNTHPFDTRAKTIALTPQGEALLDEAFAIVERIEHEFFDELGDDLEGFKDSLSRLLAVHRASQNTPEDGGETSRATALEVLALQN